MSAAYGIIESNDELSAAYFQRVMSETYFRKQLLEPYMESRLAAASRSADILSFVLHWGRFLPVALEQSFAQNAVKDYLLEKLQLEHDPVASVAEIHEIVDKAEKDRRKGTGVAPKALSLMQDLAASADRFLLNRLSLSDMTQEELLEVVFYGMVMLSIGSRHWIGLASRKRMRCVPLTAGLVKRSRVRRFLQDCLRRN